MLPWMQILPRSTLEINHDTGSNDCRVYSVLVGRFQRPERPLCQRGLAWFILLGAVNHIREILMKNLLASALLAILLVGCVTPQSGAQTVFQAKQDYAVALTAAVAYKRLPACGATAPKLCSDKAVVTQLQKADDAAIALLDGAETVARTGGGNVAMALSAAEQSVKAFVSLTKTLEK